MIVVRLTKSELNASKGNAFAFRYKSRVWKAGSIDFIFENEKDAMVFLLKFGGIVISNEEQTIEFVGSLF
jgi:hypothetical protein